MQEDLRHKTDGGIGGYPNRDADLYADRRKRFNDVLDGYECGAGDWSLAHSSPVKLTREETMKAMPQARLRTDGAAENLPKIGRWAVVCESAKGHGYFIDSVIDQADIEAVAAGNIHEGWQPVCYFDLDQLAGDEPPLEEGDMVRLTAADAPQEPLYITHASDQLSEGMIYWEYYLDKDPSAGLQAEYVEMNDDEFEVVQRGEDRRMPVRYGVAKVVTTVVFNSIPSPE